MSKTGRATTASHEIESAAQEIIREYNDGRLSRNDAVIKIFPLVYRRTLFILKFAFTVLRPQDQDDLLQEVMLRVVRSLHTYGRSGAPFLYWMDKITRNVKIDYLKGKKRNEEVFRDPDEEDSDWQIDNYTAANPDADIKIDLARLLQELPEDDRMLLHDKFFDGYTVPELAEKYDLAESTIKFHLRRAVAKVCEKLGIDKKQGPPASPPGQNRSGGSGPSTPESPPDPHFRTALATNLLAKGVTFMNCTDEDLAALFSDWKVRELNGISPEREAQALARFKRALKNEPEPEKAKGVAVGETMPQRHQNDAGFGLFPLIALVGAFTNIVLYTLNSAKTTLNAFGTAKLVAHTVVASMLVTGGFIGTGVPDPAPRAIKNWASTRTDTLSLDNQETAADFTADGRPQTSDTTARRGASPVQIFFSSSISGLGFVNWSGDASSVVVNYSDSNANLWNLAWDARSTASVAYTYYGMDNLFSYSYDPTGYLIKIADSRGRTTTIDSAATAVAGPQGDQTRYVYDGSSRLTAVTTPTGAEMKYAYDSAGNLVSVTDALGRTTSLEYDANGNPTVVTDSMMGCEIAYDALNRLVSVTSSLGPTTQYTDTYDALGRRTLTVVPVGKTTTYTYYSYDALGRLATIADSSGNAVQYTYDYWGTLLSRTDANGHTSSFTYDSAGNVPGPSITSSSPDSTTAGGPAFTLTVNGTGFALGTVVNWNGAALPTSFASANQLNAAVADSLIVNQGDGNLVIYDLSKLDLSKNPPQPGVPIWDAGKTRGSNPGLVELQGDGNLVVYDAVGNPVAATATSRGSRLVLQDDGNLVLHGLTTLFESKTCPKLDATTPPPPPSLQSAQPPAQAPQPPSNVWPAPQGTNLITGTLQIVKKWWSR
jgi:RNA polymerase sigma factor (sigma-70 family)